MSIAIKSLKVPIFSRKTTTSTKIVKSLTKPKALPPTTLNKIIRQNKEKYLSLKSQFILKYNNCIYNGFLYYFINNTKIDTWSTVLYSGDLFSLCAVSKSKITNKFAQQFINSKCKEISILYPPNFKALTIKGFLFSNSPDPSEKLNSL